MSDVIRLNLKAGNLKIKLNKDEDSLSTNTEEDYFAHQLQSHYEKGFNEGLNQMRNELAQEYEQRLNERTDEFNRILGSLEANLSEYDQAFDKIVIETAFIIAEKVVKRDISRETVINSSLRESIKKVLGANDIIIRINPADHGEVHSSDNNNIMMSEDFSKIKFEIDEKLEVGGCMIETEIGNVDARISTQLNEIKKQLEASFTNTVE